MNIKKVFEQFWVKIDTDFDVFGAANNFDIHYFEDGSNTMVQVNPLTFIEMMRDTTGKTATVVGDFTTDDYKIQVASSPTLGVGDVFKDANDNMYHIDKLENDIFTLRNKLYEDIPDGTLLQEVGNTGIYKFPLTMPSVGSYTLVIRNPENGMQNVLLPLEIVEEDFDDMQDKLDNIIINSNSGRKNKAMV